MQRPSPTVLAALLLAVLLPLFYPALLLERQLAPEAALHSVAPWRELVGPYPPTSPLNLDTAATLGPRLAIIAADPLSSALWNPWIGGGRGGWLASASEGGTPLVLIAAWLAQPGWRWSALLASTVALALAGAYWVIRLLGLSPAAAAVGAVTYALSGAVSSVWLTTDGSALALGPLLLVPLLHPTWGARWRTALGAAILSLLLYSGPQGVQFVAAAAALLVAKAVREFRPTRRWLLPVMAGVLAVAVALPRLWLHAAAGEGAAPVAAPAAPRAAGLLAMVVPFPGGEPVASRLAPTPPDHRTLRTEQAAFVGLVVLLLAAMGLLRPFPGGGRGFWVALTATALGLAHLRPEEVPSPGVCPPPFGVAALGLAVLAAAGGENLLHRLSTPTARAWVGAGLVGLVLLRLLPTAAHGLPFAPASATFLPDPVGPLPESERASRLVAFGATLPPDSTAAFSLHDLRAASLAGEPRFTALLRPRENGTISFDRFLNPQLGRLGARLLVEPASLHVFSAELFSRSVAAQGERFSTPDPDEVEVALALPEEAVRFALPATAIPIEQVVLVNGEDQWVAAPDPALAIESDAWRWFSVPSGVAAGPAKLRLRPAAAVPARPTVLWDTSGVRLLHERAGARVWLATGARPVAFLARAVEPEGSPVPADPLAVQVAPARTGALAAAVRPAAARLRLVHAAATHLVVETDSAAARLLVVLLKHRPALWRATVNGRPAPTELVDGVWTGVVVPRGTSLVELRARLPWWVLLVAALGGALSVALALGGRGAAGSPIQTRGLP